MKIIIIRDMNGHTQGIPYSKVNAQKVHDAAARAGVLFESDDELPTGRTFGGICEVIDTDDLSEFPSYNPFE
jgi:hypothetical protein